jgi:hypothetical protein
MKKSQAIVFGAFVAASLGAAAFLNAAPGRQAKIRGVSEIFNTREEYSVIAALPNVGAFLTKLREGKAMRAFFDSPLGLHFLRSAPLRSAAHLHRLLSLAPKSWQWNLYSLLSGGPVLYRSDGKSFTLVVALTAKGKLLVSLAGITHAAQEDDWLVIASDKQTLQDQLTYMKKPAGVDFPLDALLRGESSLSVAFGRGGGKSLARAIFKTAFGLDTLGGCIGSLTPGGESLMFESNCPGGEKIAVPTAETLPMEDYPAYLYFRRPGAALAHVLALGGFTHDYGYAVPHLFYSGPVGDQKSIEFLSQAFKTKSHKLEKLGEGFQIRYPSPYAYRDRKFDLFAPYLVADQQRFYWQSYLPAQAGRTSQLKIDGSFSAYGEVSISALSKKSEEAFRQLDAIYSPGHFHEFRDAWLKSAPTLKEARLTVYAKNAGKMLRIGGELRFATH